MSEEETRQTDPESGAAASNADPIQEEAPAAEPAAAPANEDPEREARVAAAKAKAAERRAAKAAGEAGAAEVDPERAAKIAAAKAKAAERKAAKAEHGEEADSEKAARIAAAKAKAAEKRAAKEAEPAPPHPLEDKLKPIFGDQVVEWQNMKGHVCLVVKPDQLYDVCLRFRDDPAFDCNLLRMIAGADYADRTELVYGLLSLNTHFEAFLKVRLDRDHPAIRSVADLWRTADWQEREIFDLFGVTFEGHPDLRRILLPDEWQGHPLRKN